MIADGATERVRATVTWAGGHQTHAALTRPVARIDQLSYYPALTERITALASEGLANAQIAGRLAAEGFRTPQRVVHLSWVTWASSGGVEEADLL